jgi:hypothetical protein
MDITTAKTLQHGEWLHHESQTQSGNQCLRIRVNGRPQTWKTRPNDVRVPVRWGMRARDQFSLHNEELREWEREANCRNDSHPKSQMFCGDPNGVGMHEAHDGYFGTLPTRCPGS